MVVAVADTHAVIWYLSADRRLSTPAKEQIDIASQDENQIAISSITLIEMVYLIEKGRIPAGRFTELAAVVSEFTSVFVEIPVDLNIARSLTRVDASLVPDMPDRILAATALHLGVPLISRDARIQASHIETI